MQSDVFCSSAAVCSQKQGNDSRCEGDDSFDRNPPHPRNVSNEGGKTHQKHSRAVNLQAAETSILAALQRHHQQIQLLLQEAERVSSYFSFPSSLKSMESYQ